jgi:two-component system sensor histidine kinase YesM
MSKERRSWFYNLPFTVKLMMFFALASIVPVIVVGAVSLRIASANTLELGVQDSLARLEFVNYRAGEIMKAKHQATLLTAYNASVRAYCEQNPRRSAEDQALLEDRTKRQVMSFYNNMDATSVVLVCEGGVALSYSSSEYSAVQKVDATTFAPLDPSAFMLFDRWDDAAFDRGETVVPYERVVLGESTNEPVARLIVNIKESVFRSLYENYEASRSSRFYIINERGVIQSCSDKAQFSRNILDALGFGLNQLTGTDGYLFSGQDLVAYRHDAQRRLYFIECTPSSRLNAGFAAILQFTLFVALICVVGCVLLGVFLSMSLTKPLRGLIGRLSKDEIGNSSGEARRNEFALISDKYSSLLVQLEKVISDYYLEQQKKKEAQIRALEFQINPHFLYNTLSTIVWMIEADEPRTAIRITKELSQFFRISISKGREYISIREEITHIELYVDIQKARYTDRILVSFDVPDALMGYYTPKLILQPLVENSIVHAMKTRSDKKFHIEIRAYCDGDDVVMEVRDNGEIATRETLEAMNEFLRHRDAARAKDEYGIGISNVHDRVQMCFGAGYGLKYHREGDQTVASIRIKAMLGEE